MTFLSPLFFWTLLSLIPLVAVYFMKTRPRKRVTNALFLWEKVLQESASKIWLKKMRNLLSLLLLLLIFLAACLSLTRPQMGSERPQDLLILLDSSVSMRALEGRETRFQKAKGKVQQWLRSMDGGQRVSLATVSDRIYYHSHLTTNTRAIGKTLKTLAPTEKNLSASALRDLEMFQKGEEELPMRILFLTDGSGDLSDLPEHIELLTLTGEQKNIGISAGDLAALPSGGAKLYFSLTSSYPEETSTEIELRHVDTGRIGKFMTLTLPAQETIHEVVEIEDVEEGIWELRVLTEDALAEDNVLSLGVNIPTPIKVYVSTQKRYFYERCVEAFSGAENLLTLASTAEEADLVLTEGEPVAGKPSLSFNDSNAPALPSVIPEVVIKDHPLILHLNPEEMPFIGAAEIDAPEGATVIVKEVSGTPLIYTQKRDGQPHVRMNLSPQKEEFFLSPLFPILVHNAARFISARETELPSATALGTTLSIPSPSFPLTETFTAPEALPVESTLEAREKHFSQLGAYRFSREKSWFIGAGTLSAHESGKSRASSSTAEEVAPPKSWSLPWLLLVLAAILLLTEDALYHRRKVG